MLISLKAWIRQPIDLLLIKGRIDFWDLESNIEDMLCSGISDIHVKELWNSGKELIWTIVNRSLMDEMTEDICCFHQPRLHSFLLALAFWFPLWKHSSPILSLWGSVWTLPTTDSGNGPWLRSGHQRTPCCWSWKVIHRWAFDPSQANENSGNFAGTAGEKVHTLCK